MKWFSQRGCLCTGIDHLPDALETASAYGSVVQADLENGIWPLVTEQKPKKFDVLVVTNYLWRPLFPLLLKCLSPGGLLLYETFAKGNETVGKPSRADFLLQPGELLKLCQPLHIVAYENGFLAEPNRFVQRITAINTTPQLGSMTAPTRHLLSLE